MHQWKGLHEYYSMETQKFELFFQKSLKFEIWLLPKSWNHLSFVNISPTLVIDTSTERSSRVLQHENQEIWFFFHKKYEIEFDLCWRAEINIQVGLTYMSTSGMHRRPFEGRHLVLGSIGTQVNCVLNVIEGWIGTQVNCVTKGVTKLAPSYWDSNKSRSSCDSRSKIMNISVMIESSGSVQWVNFIKTYNEP